MDYILAITTILTNNYLGISKRKYLHWVLHIANAIFWIVFAYINNIKGIIILSIFTIILDCYNIYSNYLRNST